MPKDDGATTTTFYVCPNKQCGLIFQTKKGVAQHFLHYSQCYKAAILPSTKQITNVDNTASQTANTQSHEMSDSDTDNNIADIDTQHDNDDNENDDTITQNINDVVDTLLPQQQTQQTNNDDTINDINDAINYNDVMQQSGSTFTASNFASTRLLKILDNANAPHFLYKDIMQWAVDSKAHGYQFESQCNSRPAVIENLVKHFKLQHH